MRRFWAAFVAGSFLFAGTAFAQSLDEKTRYIIEQGNAEQGLVAGFNAMRPLLIQQIQRASPKITPELADHISDLAQEELVALKPQVVDFITGYYKRKFTPDEISALYDFYQTPIGKKVALKINEVGAGLLTELQGFMMTTLIPRFQERLKTDAKLRSALSP